jgi:hypothetical protein
MKSRKTVNMEPTASERDAPPALDAMGRPVNQRRTEVRLGREVQHRIGQQLRAMYDEFVGQGIPQHIEKLVHRLTEQDDGELARRLAASDTAQDDGPA